jgi:hypothetical protein
MRATFILLMNLPTVLKVAWILLFFGMVLLAVGYFTHIPWQSYTGLGCLIFGYVIVIFDMINRKRGRADAAGFYTGATVAPLIALGVLIFIALLGAIVLAVQSMIHGFSGIHAMRLLHFLGIIFAFLIVFGIPRLALRASPDPKTEHGGADQPATAPESRPEADQNPKPESEGDSE